MPEALLSWRSSGNRAPPVPRTPAGLQLSLAASNLSASLRTYASTQQSNDLQCVVPRHSSSTGRWRRSPRQRRGRPPAPGERLRSPPTQAAQSTSPRLASVGKFWGNGSPRRPITFRASCAFSQVVGVSEGRELRNATQSGGSGLGRPGSRTNSRSGGPSSDPASSHPSDERHTRREWAGRPSSGCSDPPLRILTCRIGTSRPAPCASERPACGRSA